MLTSERSRAGQEERWRRSNPEVKKVSLRPFLLSRSRARLRTGENSLLTVRSGVYDCPEEERVGDLAVHPDMLVEGDQPTDDRTDETDHVAQHCGRTGLVSARCQEVQVCRGTYLGAR